jgi:hypothetical protein
MNENYREISIARAPPPAQLEPWRADWIASEAAKRAATRPARGRRMWGVIFGRRDVSKGQETVQNGLF